MQNSATENSSFVVVSHSFCLRTCQSLLCQCCPNLRGDFDTYVNVTQSYNSSNYHITSTCL